MSAQGIFFCVILSSVVKPPNQSCTKEINKALEFSKKLVTATHHSDGPASQGEAPLPHLEFLMKTYEELQPIGPAYDTGAKEESVSVQNREVVHSIMGIQTSLVSAEEGIQFSAQASN